MSNKIYDIIKILALIVIPAIATLVGTLGETWGWAYTDKIVTSINAVSVCIGAIITKSSIDYARKEVK